MWTELAIFLGSIVALYYLIVFYLEANNNYWTKRDVPRVLFSEISSLYELFTKKKSLVSIDQSYYEKIKGQNHKFAGIMEFRRPLLMVTDLELLKHILVKDFDHFVDRRSVAINQEPLFSKTLLQLEGQTWKDVRSILSPTFTTGKIRRMFQHFNRVGKSFVECIKARPQTGGSHDIIIQDIVNRFTVDVIGATAFGMETNALKDSDSMFYKMSKRLSDTSTGRILKTVFYFILPSVGNFLRLRVLDKEMMEFFTGILDRALKDREKSHEVRDDFIQMMVEARRGVLKNDDELSAFEKDALLQDTSGSGDGKKAKVVLTDELAMAQSFIFFVAGFDTVGASVNFAAYLLAVYQDIQERVYEEVKAVMEKDEGISYESVCGLEYMDMFISEILRRYPPANRLERKCVKEYKLPGSDVVIPKDLLVTVAVQGIHMDEEYYPDPEKFDPERFTPENKASRHPYAYIPFGMGPRNCIGMRFALMEVKVAVAYMVYYFLIEPSAKTPVPILIDTKFGLNRPVNDLELRFTPRSKN